MVLLARTGLTAPAVAGRGLSEGLGATGCRWCVWADEVPEIAAVVLEHGNSTVGLLGGTAYKPYASLPVLGVVTAEVVCVQEQEHPAASLVAYPGGLFRVGSAGKQDSALLGAWWRDDYPTLVLPRHMLVLYELKAQRTDVERNRRVVIINDYRNESDVLGHALD